MYYTYSDYLKNKYHEKVYKLPVNLPVTCPNRLNGACGCDPSPRALWTKM